MIDTLTNMWIPLTAFILVVSGIIQKILSYNIRNFLYSVYCAWLAFILVANVKESVMQEIISMTNTMSWLCFGLFVYFLTKSFFFTDKDESEDKQKGEN